MTKPNASHNHDVVDALLDEARAITTAANRLDTAAIDRALSILVGCSSKVVVSGVGKSGIVARKIAATDAKYTFMFTVEWEMPYFDMGSTYNYSEMVALLAPRPFMVERGHGDGVAPDEWVAYEYAKVRRLYDALRIGDRTEIEVFDGLHEINGKGTFDFLEKHLRHPIRN